jgi:hypothetical protein
LFREPSARQDGALSTTSKSVVDEGPSQATGTTESNKKQEATTIVVRLRRLEAA